MKGLDAKTGRYDLAEMDGRVVLFTNMRLDCDTGPTDLFCRVANSCQRK